MSIKTANSYDRQNLNNNSINRLTILNRKVNKYTGDENLLNKSLEMI